MKESKYLKNGNAQLPITGCYNYTYNYGEGKEVLRVSVDTRLVSFDEAMQFLSAQNRVEEYTEKEIPTLAEEGKDPGNEPAKTEVVKTNEYLNYVNDIKAEYNGKENKIEFELTKKSQAIILAEQALIQNQMLAEQNLMIQMAMTEMYENMIGESEVGKNE